MKLIGGFLAVTNSAKHLPAAATAAVVTIAAIADNTHIVRWIGWSFSEAPAADTKLTVAFAGTTKVQIHVTAAGPGFIDFGSTGLFAGEAEAVVVTLESGGGTAVGKINVTYQ